MDIPAPEMLPPQAWLEALAESDADLAAGRVVPLAAVLDMLDAAIKEAGPDQTASDGH